MEELEQLILLIGKLPTLAIWVLVGFFAYKTIVIGSIYGVIKLAIVKLHDWKVTDAGIHTYELAGKAKVFNSDKVLFELMLDSLKNRNSEYLNEDKMKEVIAIMSARK
jgi:hypothetical protein